ncbi:hypothetical protein ABT354_14940 [Streptomyces sp. NPDC000594]|uniref:hypothetical protein n=1 Tax=Streptomyces sp. NPDC000594 TaxID=3154261 RepID=UPI0033246EF5
MGWTVLYIAFGAVALWLLGEVLLQYKARLRWRLLAFGGFLGVVIGVLLSSVVVIGLGAIAFAAGQTCVTLSFRKGFSTGWALGGRPGASRRRRAGKDAPGEPGASRLPGLEVSDLAEETAVMDAAVPDPVYRPEPMPDDTHGYGVYTGGFDAPGTEPGEPAPGSGHAPLGDDFPPYDPYPGQVPDHGVPVGHGAPAAAYDLPPETQQFPAYTDPFAGAQPYPNPFDGNDSFGNAQPYEPDPYYAQQAYLNDTPPGGVWVPQQRETDPPQPPAFDYDYDQGPNEQQYRH